MTLPNFFPIDCPPFDAKEASGIVYRAYKDKKRKEINYKWFKSYRQKQPNRQWPPNYCECQLCAVSVITDPNEVPDLVDALSCLPGETVFIACGNLNSSTGLIKHTPDAQKNLLSHHDWWIYDGVDPSSNFEYYDQGDLNGSD